MICISYDLIADTLAYQFIFPWSHLLPQSLLWQTPCSSISLGSLSSSLVSCLRASLTSQHRKWYKPTQHSSPPNLESCWFWVRPGGTWSCLATQDGGASCVATWPSTFSHRQLSQLERVVYRKPWEGNLCSDSQGTGKAMPSMAENSLEPKRKLLPYYWALVEIKSLQSPYVQSCPTRLVKRSEWCNRNPPGQAMEILSPAWGQVGSEGMYQLQLPVH